MEYGLFDDFDDNKKTVAGADEAGRGPLAGPVVAACVVLPDDFPIEILNDSKKLDEKKRLEAETLIKQKAVAYEVVVISHGTIDKINILQASLLGMKNAYMKVKEMTKVDILLVDGNKCPDIPDPVEAIVKGDAKIPAIMAASILAKNERDRIMVEYDAKYPGYGFKKHKGYPTKAHYEAIKKLGPCPIHRTSFKLYKEDKVEKELLLF